MSHRFVVLENGEYRIVDYLSDTWDGEVMAEVAYGDEADNPLVYPRNPYASPYDLLWPMNMFTCSPVRLEDMLL